MIAIEGLHKSFGRLAVLRDVSMSAEPGRVTALVGPNGSGKTTLIKCLLGLVRPDRGSIEVDGQRVTGNASYRERIGYMPQKAPFPDNLSPREIFSMLKDLRGPGVRTDESLVESFELAPEMDKAIRTLSGGTRQKVSAAVAFLFEPRLLVLDEPTAGLDPVASSVLKDKILASASSGAGILLTSHIMSEVEELTDDLIFLLDGAPRFCGAVSELKQYTGQERLERAVAVIMRSGLPSPERIAA